MRALPLFLCLCLAAVPAAAQTDMPSALETQVVPLEDCPIPPATPQTEPGTVPAGLVDDLLDWIADTTEYDVDMVRADPPQITFCSAGDLIRYEDVAVLVGDGLQGLYDNHFQRIVLVRPWSADAPRDRALLLHELIHRVQLANRGWDCPQAPEWQAYQLQAQYLAEHTIESGFDWFHIYMLSRCPNDVHPAQRR